MKTKELLTIEFRYMDSKNEWHESKTITIGVFDTLTEAIQHGNKVLQELETKFDLHKFPDGTQAEKKRFGLNNGCFGLPTRLVSNQAYLKTQFDFYAKITQLVYVDLVDTLSVIEEANKRYKEHMRAQQ